MDSLSLQRHNFHDAVGFDFTEARRAENKVEHRIRWAAVGICRTARPYPCPTFEFSFRALRSSLHLPSRQYPTTYDSTYSLPLLEHACTFPLIRGTQRYTDRAEVARVVIPQGFRYHRLVTSDTFTSHGSHARPVPMGSS